MACPGTTKEQIKEKAKPADWSPAKRRQKDLEVTWTKKHGKSSHGYKLSASVDRKHKLIRKWMTDTASVHDSQHFDAVLDDWNTSAEVYADRGYPSQEREEQL
jgi:IS5 family transposase